MRELFLERQNGRSLDAISNDHLARYVWAANVLRSKIGTGRVLDAASGVGYGSFLLAEAGFQVDALDIAPKAQQIQKECYNHKNVAFHLCDIAKTSLERYDAIVSFETIEHLPHPEDFIKKWDARIILASVPNETALPYSHEAFPFHYRHYTKDQFSDLLPGKKQWFTQYGKFQLYKIHPGHTGRTLLALIEK